MQQQLLEAKAAQGDLPAFLLDNKKDKEKVNKVASITSLLPDLQDPHIEFSLLRSCLALPKMMFILRTVDTSDHQQLLEKAPAPVNQRY